MQQGKTSYEIRADLLRLAFDILMTRREQEKSLTGIINDPKLVYTPTTEEVVEEADKLNKFVSKDR